VTEHLRTTRIAGPVGLLVILVGPDGVGKTTAARAVIERHGGPTGYFHFLPPIGSRLAREPDATVIPPPPKSGAGASVVLGSIRILRNAARCWVGYVRTVRPALKQGYLVVGDRWMYGYLVQPDALKFGGPRLLARAVVRLLPRPHLIVNLSAPAELIRTRKQELSLRQIEQELLAWSSLPVPNLYTIDATREPPVIATEILQVLGSIGGSR
jgi:thymidylate kinase